MSTWSELKAAIHKQCLGLFNVYDIQPTAEHSAEAAHRFDVSCNSHHGQLRLGEQIAGAGEGCLYHAILILDGKS
jgi:hypothetical protein